MGAKYIYLHILLPIHSEMRLNAPNCIMADVLNGLEALFCTQSIVPTVRFFLVCAVSLQVYPGLSDYKTSKLTISALQIFL